ncbi:WXG100 family type VII secretion target [Nocardia terpenica]|uniref:WXG100 family type VII secretion target n=1 Tax=Nocardia terpenica TaxID=455432 RepID=UPI000AD1CB3E|nr:hypothetical protein [Nocardia terpenica]NQE89321.1 hypothetical protein [Nocardia terpenica]
MGSTDPNPDDSIATKLVKWGLSQKGASSSRDSAAETDKNVRTGGYDPDYLPHDALEPFMSMSHQDIVQAVNDMQPGSMHSSAEAWGKVADAVMFNNLGLNAKVQKAISQGWEGATADAIQNATHRFVGEMTDMHNVTQGVAERITSAAYGAEVAKGAVPSVPQAPGAPSVKGAENPATVIGYLTAASDAEQAARQAMINYYVPAYPPAGEKIPTYVPPTGPSDGPGANAPGVNGPGWLGGSGGGTNPSGANNSSGDSQHGPQSPSDQQTNPAGTDSGPASTDPSGLVNSSAGQGNNPQGPGGAGAATAPASVNPNATTPAGVGSTGGTGGGWGLGRVCRAAGSAGAVAACRVQAVRDATFQVSLRQAVQRVARSVVPVDRPLLGSRVCRGWGCLAGKPKGRKTKNARGGRNCSSMNATRSTWWESRFRRCRPRSVPTRSIGRTIGPTSGRNPLMVHDQSSGQRQSGDKGHR